MIRKDLLELQYYFNRLSKFMQESYGITGQVQTFWSLLKQVNDCYDDMFKRMDLFQVNKKEGESYPNPEGELLDKIGAIFGCEREFTVPIYDPSNPLEIEDYAQISLTDSEFIDYIKTQAIKQNFDGSRGTLQSLYSTYVNGVAKPGLVDLRFLYITEDMSGSNESAVCVIRWDIENPSDNMRILFENGYLTVESLGILYKRVVTNFNNLAYYYDGVSDPTPQNRYAQTLCSLLESEPADWANGGYYSVIGNATSTWDPSEIYAVLSGSDYLLIPNKPSNWPDFYSNCKVLAKTDGSETYAANTYYEAETVGGLYA